MFEKLKEKRLMNKLMKGQFRRTPKGECFLNYCMDIVSGKLKEDDIIEDYENSITALLDKLKSENLEIDRVTAAAVLVVMFSKGRGAYEEE